MGQKLIKKEIKTKNALKDTKSSLMRKMYSSKYLHLKKIRKSTNKYFHDAIQS